MADNEELRAAIVQALSDNNLRRALERILERERELREQWPDKPSWWMWRITEVGVPWQYVQRLIHLGVVKQTYASSRNKYFALVDYELTSKMYRDWKRGMRIAGSDMTPRKEQRIPSDLFDIIEGHEELKWVFLRSLEAENYHILLVGPPASGKTIWLLEISRLPGSIFVDVPHATRVGLRDLIIEFNPRYLLLDELDKATDKDFLNSLGTVMELGKVVKVIHNSYVEFKTKVNIYATANTLRTIPEHIRSRFDIYEMPSYTDEELFRIIRRLLVKRYGKTEKVAEKIAYAVVYQLKSKDIRDAIKMAKLVKAEEDVEMYLKVKKKYKRGLMR